MSSIEILAEKILNLFNKKVLMLLDNVHKKYPETSMEEMIKMWSEQWNDELEIKNMPSKQHDDKMKTCKHIYIKGKKC
jgi:prephenate dehydrogenase